MEPVFVSWTELGLGEMAENCGHGHLTPAPGMAKVELEGVVLDVLVACTALETRSAQVAEEDASMSRCPHRLHLAS